MGLFKNTKKDGRKRNITGKENKEYSDFVINIFIF